MLRLLVVLRCMVASFMTSSQVAMQMQIRPTIVIQKVHQLGMNFIICSQCLHHCFYLLFGIEARIIGRVEAAAGEKVTVTSAYGQFTYPS